MCVGGGRRYGGGLPLSRVIAIKKLDLHRGANQIFSGGGGGALKPPQQEFRLFQRCW